MRKLFMLLSIMVTSLVLVGCTGDGEVATPPSYTNVRVENTSPIEGSDFVTFYRAKQDTVLVEVSVTNPDDLIIKSVVVNGITFNSHRFTSSSTNEIIYFEMSVGTTLGETVYSVDRINYLDGENTKTVEGFSNNEFMVYVFKEAPAVERENYDLSRESISIDFNITDNDNVIAPGTLKALLYSGETLVAEQVLTKGFTTVEFTSLLANKNYEVKVVASYNLDDNTGLVSNYALYSGTYLTLENGLPSATIDNVDVSSNSVEFDVEFVDDDDVVVEGGLSVVIFNGNTQLLDVDYTINIVDSTVGLSFDELLNDNTYTIKVLADYDLNDGFGIKEENVLAVHTFSTLPREVPTPQLINLDLLENSIEFDVYIDDPDSIIDQSSIIANLYIEDVFVDSADINDYHVDFQVNNLFANYEFKIELVADYDLNNGLGVQEDEVIYSEVFSTLENAIPSVDINEIQVAQGYLTVLLEVLDGNETLIGSLEAVLYEEDTPVQTINFNVDTNELVFDYATKAGVSYYVEIFADYNLRDGSGAVYDESLRRIVSFTAEAKAPIAEVKNVSSDTSSITLDVTVIDADITIDPGTIVVYIYHEGLLIDQTTITTGDNTITFNGLLSNNEYEIVVEADFDLDDGSGILQNQNLITHIVSTQVKATPTTEIDNEDTTDETIIFDADIIDNDSVIIGGTIVAVLYHEDVEMDSVVLSDGGNFGVEFIGLLSNNNYEVIIYVDYDLNDGVGVVEDYIVAEFALTTEPKDAPTALFTYSDATETSIEVDVVVTDDFGVITPGTLQAVLILGDTPAVGIDPIDLTVGLNSDIEFVGLFSNERYYVSIVANYDLNDGEAEVTDAVLSSDYVRTVALDDVYAFIGEHSTTINSIILDVEVQDLSGVINGDIQAVLYKDDVEIDAIDIIVGSNVDVTFNGLDSETDYVVKIEADYDLNESTGPVLAGELDFVNVSTLELSAPLATINNFIASNDSFSVDIFLDNSDGTVTGNRFAVLYKDDATAGQQVILVDGDNQDVTFTNLLSDTLYEVRVIVDYDLNDEAGEQLAQVLDDYSGSTLAKYVPNIITSNLVITNDEISFDYQLDDVDDVLIDGTVVATLLKDGIPQATKTLYTNSVTFGLSGFLADYEFEIEITGNYDLDDDAGVIVGGNIATLDFATLAYNAPTGMIQTLVVNQNTVDVTIDISDLDNTNAGNIYARLYDSTNTQIEDIPLSVGANTISFTQTLDHGTFYSVVVYADYNLLDGVGTITDVILAERVETVYNKLLPQAAITNVIIADEQITFDVDVFDNDAVITGGTTVAELYLDGVYQDEVALPLASNPGLVFNTLYSNREYEIRIVTGYNNDNGNGDMTGYIMSSELYTTLTKETPSVVVTTDTIEASTLIFDIVFTDDSTISSVRNAVLYDEDDVVVSTEPLIVGDNLNVTYAGLLGTTDYRLEIEVTYDLNDGEGDITESISTVNQSTPSSSAPIAGLTSVTATTSTVVVEFEFNDEDDVATDSNLRIYEGAVLVDTIAITVNGSNQTETFTGLDPNKAYTVKLESTYDLNDLDGVHTDEILDDLDTSTESIIEIQNEVTDKKVNTLEVVFDDYEDILVDATNVVATLKQANGETFATYIVTPNGVNTIDMVNLLSNNDYSIEFTATYDVGAGSVTELVYIHEFTTLALNPPLITISDASTWVSVPDLTVSIDIATDDDNIANDTEWNAVLYQNGVEVLTVDIDLAQGGNPEGATTIIVFTGYDHTDGNSYTIVVEADADFNEYDALDPLSGEQETELASKIYMNAEN